MIARTLTLLAALAGCAAGPRVGRDAITIQSVLANVARQVQRCYRLPRVGHEGRQISTQLRVRVAPDGSLGAPPQMIAQTGITPTNRIHARPMAAAAIDAVVRCTPLRLPDDIHRQGVVAIDLVFAPLARA